MNKWKHVPASHICAGLCFVDDFVISKRHENFTLSYRPTGRHVHVGCYKTLRAAQRAAREYQPEVQS